jgi:ketosteroid isomerase-like protein
MAAAGDLALVWGEWLAKGTGADSQPSELTGVYSAIWKRQADQTWKMVFDNGRPYSRAIIASLKTRLAALAKKQSPE